MLIQRDILPKLESYIKSKEIIALVGLRQVGKTTLLNEIKKKCSNSIYVTFEDIEVLNLFENNIEEFIKLYVQNYDYLFIDEVQYSQNSGKRLKYIYDTKWIKIFISGSSKSDLALHSLSRLVGRVLIFNIMPISFREFLNYKSKENLRFLQSTQSDFTFNKLKPYFEEYLQFGGYPEIVLEEDFEIKKVKLRNILNTYILKEIKEILGFRNSFDFENVLKRLALADGGILNKSNISLELGINRNKIDKIISILEKTGVIQIIYPYLKNKTKQMIKSPKTYFIDLGFKNTLINNFNNLELKQDKGEIYENFVLNCLTNNNYVPQFFRIENESEVDFVIEKDGKTIGIEIKSKLKKDIIPKATTKFIEKYNPDLMLILNENTYSNQKKIIFSNYFTIITENF